MTTDPFTTAARAEARDAWGFKLDPRSATEIEDLGQHIAVWARDHLAAQEPTGDEHYAAAQVIYEAETMAEVRARANSHDGCPTAIFDRALAAHDAQVKRDAAREALDGLDPLLAARDGAENTDGIYWARETLAEYRDTEYPEESAP